MTDVKKKPSKIQCKIKRRFKYSDSTPTRKRDETVKLSQAEYDFALSNGCLY